VRKVTAWLASFVVWVLVGAAVIGAAIAMLIPASSGFGHITDAQARAVPPLPPLPERSIILDRYGNTLQEVYFGQDRAPVHLNQIPQKVIDAVLSTEDREFYSHSGVDFRGIARAFLSNVGADKTVQGGSTITQQLVKNSLFPNGRPRDLKAKLHEAILAERLEQSYSKDQILERYLNTIYFGEGAYGIQAAAERYFNKDVSQLNLVEGALLAGVISNPSGYDPLEHPQAARQRRHDVLTFMVESGYITTFEEAHYDQAGLPRRNKLDPKSGPPYHDATYAPNSYFVAAMEKWLLGDCTHGPSNVAQAALGKTCAARSKLLYQGGLRITTTYDPKLQTAADNAVTSAPLPSPLDAAIAVVDNKTGAVRAVANRKQYVPGEHEVDVATGGDGKQPGSSMKVFTLAAALASGYSPDDSARGGNCHFDFPQSTQNGYDVKSDVFGSPSLKTAIAQSVNCSFVNLEVSMGWGHTGPKKVAAMANTLGLGKRFADTDFVTSLTLGTIGVTPLQLASAYSTLADDGMRHRPVYVTRIVASDGAVLYDRPDGAPGTQVVPQNLARTETAMLEGVIKNGTGTSANIGRPAAGKTGTTTDGANLWFTGYTPELTASVWVGIEGAGSQPLDPPLTSSQAFGGSVSAPIWKTFMTAALDGTPATDFNQPDWTAWPAPECVSADNGNQPPGRIQCFISFTPPPSSPSTTTPTTAPPGKKRKGHGHGGQSPSTTTPATVPKGPPNTGT
jgi:penicillin-binding protein 1A